MKIVRYWHKSKGPSKNDELHAQKLQEEKIQGQSEKDELLAHLSQGVSQKAGCWRKNRKVLAKIISYWHKNSKV